MNILTFDIEEWYLEKALYGGREFRYRLFDQTLDKVLDLLDGQGIHATFFCLGKMASDYPDPVRKIADRGHEIGCHSDSHQWLTKMTPETLQADTRDALHALEDLVGKPVTSYRAPAFSLTRENPWAVEVLAQCGITADASVFPAVRDIGGYPGFPYQEPCRIRYGNAVLKEYPIPLMSLAGRRLAFSGGGYFRLLPLPLVRREMNRRDYTMCYFHLLDMISEKVPMKSKAEYEAYFHEKGTLKNRVLRYVKTNIGSGEAFRKLSALVKAFPFTSLSEAGETLSWDDVPEVKL